MRKLLIFLSVCIFSCYDLRIAAQTLHCENWLDKKQIVIFFKMPSYSFHDTILPSVYREHEKFQWIDVDDKEFGIIDSVGMPALPQISFEINVPLDADDLTLDFVDSTVYTEYLHRKILPNQLDVDKEDTNHTFRFCIDKNFYSSSSSYYDSRLQMSNAYIVRGKKGVRITFFPFRYTPDKNRLDVVGDAMLVLDYSGGTADSQIHSTSDFEDFFASYYKNYEPNEKDQTAPVYLIITPKEYENHLTPFIEYKSSLGYTVDVESISPEEMSVAKVHHVINTRYADPEKCPDYVLLVGDSDKLPPADGNQLGTDKNDPITDMPYVYIEDNEFPGDAFIGRWPVSDEVELRNIIRKTIYMEVNMSQLEKKVLLVSGDHCSWFAPQFFMRRSFDVGNENVRVQSFIPNGFNVELRRRPYLQTVRNKMAWNPLVFAYSGHGSTTSMGRLYCEDNEDSYIKDLTIDYFDNQTYPMVFVFACKTGNFASGVKSIGESWICSSKGSVTYLGSSVNTLCSSDKVLEEGFLGDAFMEGTNRSVASAITLGKEYYCDYLFSWCEDRRKRFTKSYNLLGDPSFRIRGTSCPSEYLITGEYILNGDVKEYKAATRIVVGSGATIASGEELYLSAGDEIVFEDGFESVIGSELEAWIGGCCNGTLAMMNIGTPSDDTIEKKTNDIVAEELLSFQLYPNPTDGDFFIKFDANTTGDVQFLVYDMMGKIIFEKTIPIVYIGTQEARISMDNSVPAGVYNIVIKKEGNSYYKKFVKQ